MSNKAVGKAAHKWAVGKSEGGKWIAVATTAPYFCFEADSPEELDAIANRALDFYFEGNGVIETVPLPGLRQTTISHFSPRKIKERELV